MFSEPIKSCQTGLVRDMARCNRIPFAGSFHWRFSVLPLMKWRVMAGRWVILYAARPDAGIHFRMEQIEAVLSGWFMQARKAVQSRSESSCSVRAMKSQNQSALRRSQNRSIGLKSGE